MHYIGKGSMSESKRDNGVGVTCILFLQDFLGSQHCHGFFEFLIAGLVFVKPLILCKSLILCNVVRSKSYGCGLRIPCWGVNPSTLPGQQSSTVLCPLSIIKKTTHTPTLRHITLGFAADLVSSI